MMMYWTCPCCGANLDPGERCDCNRNVVAMVHEDLGYLATAGTFNDFSAIEFGEGKSK